MLCNLQSKETYLGNEPVLDSLFWIATEHEIKNAETTDVYFVYTKRLLEYSVYIRRL